MMAAVILFLLSFLAALDRKKDPFVLRFWVAVIVLVWMLFGILFLFVYGWRLEGDGLFLLISWVAATILGMVAGIVVGRILTSRWPSL